MKIVTGNNRLPFLSLINLCMEKSNSCNMNNPFDSIEARLSNIESLLLDIKHPSSKETPQGDIKLNVDETAQYLGITKPTVYSKVSRGELPACRAPGSKRIFFYLEDLEACMKRGRKKTISEINDTAEEYLVKENRAE